ncbi:MAG: ArgR family transcriptional regulator [Bacteroidales bacterium]
MKNKTARIQKIKDLISGNCIDSQGKLLSQLQECGFDLTQATLSRDLKRMRIAKVGDGDGGYTYILPHAVTPGVHVEHHASAKPQSSSPSGFVSMDFSGQFGVIKTRPGYAGGIALEIDALDSVFVMGTIAGDDTILVILKDGVSLEEITDVLENIIPTIREKTV